MTSRRQFTLAGGSAALALGLGAPALVGAQEFPSKAVRIVVPYPPGGFNDTLARTISQKLSPEWKQSVVVDNRPGGNTLIGNTAVVQSPPDGHTLLITPLPYSVLPSLYGAKMPYDALKDFAPVIHAASTQNVLAVRQGFPVNSVKELIAYARKNPGKVNYGTPGSGSSNHLSMELFKSMTGTYVVHIPYKGSAPAVVGLLAGETDVMFDNIPNLLQQIKAGKVTAIGVTGSTRSPLLPDVPTVAEAGVPGYEVNVWFGLQAPAGTPPAVIARLNQSIGAMLRDPDVVQRFRAQGVEVVGGSPEQFGKLIAAEITKWGKVVKRAGIKVD
jgi:tripartite-type tricarboxylate transporter receptor subunit TctC